MMMLLTVSGQFRGLDCCEVEQNPDVLVACHHRVGGLSCFWSFELFWY